jgi:hypothetical protein
MTNKYFNDYARFTLFTYPTVITALIATIHTRPRYSFNYIYVNLTFFLTFMSARTCFMTGMTSLKIRFKSNRPEIIHTVIRAK